VIGGLDSDGNLLNDVWKSIDGVRWIQTTTFKTKFSKRINHTSVSVNNEIYVIGGLGFDDKFLNDVWKS